MSVTAASGKEVAHRVPVIGITGYLGAGKTTLLNHVLRRPGARIGVVVNDFGRINVDAALVAGQVDEAESIAGGCLCCLEDAGGLDDALEKLSHPRLRLDVILIEASGIAEPLALARLIRFSGAEHVRPGGMVEVVDAAECFRTVDVGPEPPARYDAATLVVIGKSDMLPEHDRERVITQISERIRTRNQYAHVVVADHGRIDPALVFDTAIDHDPSDQLPIGQLIREQDEHHEDHAHATAVSLAFSGPISPGALIDLLEDPPPGAYRIKGRVRVRGLHGERGYLVNLVGRSIHVMPLREPPPDGELVAIGVHLDPVEAQSRMNALIEADATRPDAPGFKRLQRYRRLSD